MIYKEAVDYIEGLLTFGIKPGLQRIKRLLECLGNPQTKYKTIHVTGTNGKGSVCAMLAEILKTADIRVGLFTSPHLVSYRERIKADGLDISELDFSNLVDDIKFHVTKMVDKGNESPTEFEVLTAMAFKYFADQKVEYAVIEVGLGGLLDSTNIIIPKVSVITNVANDHAEKCGGDLRGIAIHKAGIIKEDIPVVTGATGEALDIIYETAREKRSTIFVLGKDFTINDSLQLSLIGKYQKFNAAIAIKAVQLISDDRINNSIINNALQHTYWPGRFELFSVKGKTIIIDGAHNGAGAKSLRESLDEQFPHERRVFLFGVLKDKDIDDIIDNLFREEDLVIVTRPQSNRAAETDDIYERLKFRSIKAITIDDNEKSFKKFLDSNADIFICAGSLYLVGHIRNLIETFN